MYDALWIIFIAVVLFFLWPKTRIKSKPVEVEKSYEETQKPQLTEEYLTLSNYVGQKDNIDYIMGHINKSKRDNNPLPHIILWGSGGLGKSTLVKAIAKEMGGRFIEVIPANLRTVNDLFSILFMKKCLSCGTLNHFSVNKCLSCKSPIKISYYPVLIVNDNDILFLEECHGLKDEIEEAMYSFMQDGYIMLRFCGMDQMVKMPKMTIAGATTKVGDLNKPFRDRFRISVFLAPYKEAELQQIIQAFCQNKGLKITQKAVEMISEVSVGVPRIAKKYVLDSATRGDIIDQKEVQEILSLLKVDKNGLEEIHRKILNYIYSRTNGKNYGAGPDSIAGSVGITKSIYLEVYEPTLLYKEFLYYGNRGRVLTDKGKKEYFENN